MAEQMYLILTIRKPVDDRDQARTIVDLIKDRLTDRPDLDVSAHVTNHFDLDED